MERDIDLDRISDGRLYDSNDMVKADCGDCRGCSACCRGMGNTVVLDPLDIFRMEGYLNCGFEQLLEEKLELNVVDGMILPNLKMTGAQEACGFLNSEGRCSIHPARPGICRIFPLGRLYENGEFRYFLQIHECRKENRAKVKVKKWIDTPDPVRYSQYICDWHYFLKDAQHVLEESAEEKMQKDWNLYLLRMFYLTPYRQEDKFYPQFYQRYFQAREVLESMRRNE